MQVIRSVLRTRKRRKGLFASYANVDCRVASARYLPDDSIDLIVTDPPYGINGDRLHEHYNRNESFVLGGYQEVRQSEYEEFSRSWISEAKRVLRPGGSMYLLSGWTNLAHILNCLTSEGFELVNHIIWKYNFGVFTQQKFVTSHYHVLFVAKPGLKRTFNTYSRYSPSEKNGNGRSTLYADMEDVWTIDREYKTGKVRHKNELPTKLLVKMIQYSSNEGDVVADFFAGSFSTAKVAKGLKRSSVSFEISEEACRYQVPRVAEVQWGDLMEEIPHGKDDRPKNQYKTWTDDEVERVVQSYLGFRREGMTKKDSIRILGNRFERGYFSLLNVLKRQGY